jgi:hypothetical protein
LRAPGALITAHLDRNDITADRERAENSENADAAEPIENSEPKDPTDPIDRADPTEPMDKTDPLEAMHNSESFDRRDHSEVGRGFVIPPASRRRAYFASATLPAASVGRPASGCDEPPEPDGIGDVHDSAAP